MATRADRSGCPEPVHPGLWARIGRDPASRPPADHYGQDRARTCLPRPSGGESANHGPGSAWSSPL